jgi:hypothetical protein
MKRSSSSGRVCGRSGCPTPEEIKRMGLKEDVEEQILKASNIMDSRYWYFDGEVIGAVKLLWSKFALFMARLACPL